MPEPPRDNPCALGIMTLGPFETARGSRRIARDRASRGALCAASGISEGFASASRSAGDRVASGRARAKSIAIRAPTSSPGKCPPARGEGKCPPARGACPPARGACSPAREERRGVRPRAVRGSVPPPPRPRVRTRVDRGGPRRGVGDSFVSRESSRCVVITSHHHDSPSRSRATRDDGARVYSAATLDCAAAGRASSTGANASGGSRSQKRPRSRCTRAAMRSGTRIVSPS